jgi:DNA-binding NarL/FixJ family response regulator
VTLTIPADDLVVIIEPNETQRLALSELVSRVFGTDKAVTREVASLSEWTRINDLSRFANMTVIIDANTPDDDGNLAAKLIWQKNSRCKIVFWSYAHRPAYLAEIRRMAPPTATFAYVLHSDMEDALAFALASVCFHNNVYISPACRDTKSNSLLTKIDYDTLLDVAFGLTDKAISQRRSISVRGVQNRLTTLLQKLGCDPTEQPLTADRAEFFNSRTKLIYEAFSQGHITRHDIAFHRPYFERWAASASTPNNKALAAAKTVPLEKHQVNKAEACPPIPFELRATS